MGERCLRKAEAVGSIPISSTKKLRQCHHMSQSMKNLLLPAADTSEELFETLLQRQGIRVERIVSNGHATPEGEWYDQSWDEWVLLLSGKALLQIEGESELKQLYPGDTFMLPAHCRHRVAATDQHEPTIWLALHFDGCC